MGSKLSQEFLMGSPTRSYISIPAKNASLWKKLPDFFLHPLSTNAQKSEAMAKTLRTFHGQSNGITTMMAN
jgi:hypothetical protein